MNCTLFSKENVFQNDHPLYLVKHCDGKRIGQLVWSRIWGKYSLSPESRTLYLSECLRDIADYIDKLNN